MNRCPGERLCRDYLEGRLSPGEDRRFTEHVRECPSCEATLAGLVAATPRTRPADPATEATPPDLVDGLTRLWEAAFPPVDLSSPEHWPDIEGYEILGVLGRGGTGVVYRARQKDLGREVALKMIASGERSSPHEARCLLRDAATAAGLRHEHIVPVYTVGQHRGLPYCVMELVAGGSLARRVAELPARPREAARLVAAAARALHFAHRHGFCHRDVKPANILLRVRCPDPSAEGAAPRLDDLDACVSDFGLARPTRDASLTLDGAIVGTPGYAAPEQVRCERPSPAADVFGLGAVLYECLTGQPPFRAATPFDALLRTVHREPERPRSLNSRLPRDLETVCLKCLEKEPSRRYASAAALADDLERWLRGEPVRGRRTGPLGRVRRWCRRKPVAAGLVAALALSLVGGVAGVFHQWRAAEAARRAAVASAADARLLLGELLRFNPAGPLEGVDCYPRPLDAGPLLKAEAHCARLLRENPGDTGLRVALTRLRGGLGKLACQRGQIPEGETRFREARDLWAPLVQAGSRDPAARDWLATAHYWLADAAGWRADPLGTLASLRQADALWQELADEQPDNLDFFRKTEACRRGLSSSIDARLVRDQWLRPLEEDAASLARLARERPPDRGVRRRLAATCLYAGDIHHREGSEELAASYWREAYRHFRDLAVGPREDLSLQISLALCSARLMGNEPCDPHYLEAVSLFERAGQRLAALAEQHPGDGWLRHVLLTHYCSLAACHAKAGATDRAGPSCGERVRALAADLCEQQADPLNGPGALTTLLGVAGLLRDAKETTAARAAAGKAAALASRYAALPARDPGFTAWLAGQSLLTAALLRHLGDAEGSLRQAQEGLRGCEELFRANPDHAGYGNAVSEAWLQVGKALWELGRADECLAAFGEAAVAQRRVFDRNAADPTARGKLSRCYDRLAYWGGRAGRRAEAAAAIREREKLWPGDAAELAEAARDFAALANAVGPETGPPTSDEQAERQHYLGESTRLKRSAEEAERRAGRKLAAAPGM
jgi:tetratricopeptide (TPR) repeat protein